MNDGAPGSAPSAGVLVGLADADAVTPVANEGWIHVAEGSTVAYRANPPASGPHYPVWAPLTAGPRS